MLLLLIDFGLVVLIWMTQLVVYPGFVHFQEQDLVRWHHKYTTNISYLVMPLMLAQLVFHLHGAYVDFHWWRTIALLLISFAWINTFMFAVPKHNNISAQTQVHESAKKLVKINWYRVLIWTSIFLINLLFTFLLD